MRTSIFFRVFIFGILPAVWLLGCAGPREQAKAKRDVHLEKITQLELEIAQVADSSKIHELATLHLKNGNPDQCLIVLDKIKEEENYETHHLRATAHKFKGNVDLAQNSWEKSLELNPKFAKACYNLGVLSYGQDQVKEAKKHWKRTLKIDPTYHKASYNLGVLHHEEGDLDKALGHYEMTLKYNPKHVKANINLGLTHCKLNNIDSGIECFKQAVTLDPDNYFAHYNLGLGQAMNGNIQEAINFWEKAVDMNGRDPWLYFNLAIAYDKVGNTKKAIKLLDQALKIDPKFEQAKLEYRSLLRSQRGY